jgi:Na+-driven multidrug efflux pump
VSINKESIKEISYNIFKIAIPAMVGQIFALITEVINTAFIGHLGETAKVAGVGLGNMYINICCFSVFIGLNGAVLTLVSQAYGSGNYHKCGVFLNRGRVVSILAFIPITIILL